MTYQQILNMDYISLVNLSEPTLRRLVSQVNTAANKRYKNLLKNDIQSRAVKVYDRSGGLLTTKGKKGKTALITELNRAREFLDLKSSTVKGAKEVLKTLEDIRTEPDKTIDVFDIYNRVVEFAPEIVGYISDDVLKLIHRELKHGLSVTEIEKMVDDYITDWYEKNMMSDL